MSQKLTGQSQGASERKTKVWDGRREDEAGGGREKITGRKTAPSSNIINVAV